VSPADEVDVGAILTSDGATEFHVWAPFSPSVAVRVMDRPCPIALEAGEGGYFTVTVPDCPAGSRYRFVLGDGRELADPASRSQPDGVLGPSSVVDLQAHTWRDGDYRPRPLWDHVMVELHIGTFTPLGTFDAAVAELDGLVKLGISAVEIMPVAQFPGRRNWGYDGVFPYAVHDTYGGPAGLQRLVDAAHQRGLAVVLDVVYNHLGPEGNVLGGFGPYLTDRYRTPWGPAVNFDGPGSDDVRRFFVGNARQWFRDFHIDGLRLDAVHEMVDRSARPFLADLADLAAGQSEVLGRRCFLVAESADNDPRLVTSAEAGGLGLDAQWNDDFHHALHTALTREHTGYYADYHGVEDLARALDQGFVYQGQHSVVRRRRHGAPSGAVDPERFVLFAQNHDHIGNRARGDRLVTQVSSAQAELAAAVVLLSPGIPMLFMGEESGETAPFPYFVDHGDPELLAAVRAGRAREFPELDGDEAPFDPADPATFDAAHAAGAPGGDAPCARRALVRSLIALRRHTPALRRSGRADVRAWAQGGVLTLWRRHPAGDGCVLGNFSPTEVTVSLPGTPGMAWSEAGPDGGAERRGRVVTLGPWAFGIYLAAPTP
jgi:maltooligosyltrehalose trehalohydrolase